MAGEKRVETLVKEMLEYAAKIMEKEKMYPWVGMVVKEGVVISRGYNYSRQSQDPMMFSGVTAVRWAQESLDPGDLSGCSLYSVFQPTLLDFDIALWAGIREFVWSVGQDDFPNHYSGIAYTPLDYDRHKPGEITIKAGVMKEEALKLVRQAVEARYWDFEGLHS